MFVCESVCSVAELTEASVDFGVEVIEELADFDFGGGWQHELHVVNLANNVVFAAQRLLNEAHRDFLLTLVLRA